MDLMANFMANFAVGVDTVLDFLFSTPLDWLADFITESESLWEAIPVLNTLLPWIRDYLGNQPLIYILVGGGLVGVLSFKIVKFVLNIVT